MMESMLAFPAATAGLGNQPLEPDVLADGTLHFELTASIVDWEVSPGNVVQAWAYNGMVPGPRIDVEVGDTVEVADHQRVARSAPTSTGTASTCPTTRTASPPITQDARWRAGRDLHLPVHRHRAGDRDVPRPRPRPRGRAQRPVRHVLRRRCRSPAGRTVSGIPVPADLTIAQDIPMVLNDAGVIGLSPQRQELPGHRARRRRRWATGSGSRTSTRASRSTRCTCTASSRS